MARRILWRALAGFAAAAAALIGNAQSADVQSPRVYVFDGGVLASETARYRLTDADVEEVPLSVASFLVVHPRGVLMWDAGAVADHERTRRARLRAAPAAPRRPRALREARADASVAACGRGLQAVGRHASRAVALPLGSHRRRESVRGCARGSCRSSSTTRCSPRPRPAARAPRRSRRSRTARPCSSPQDEHDVFGDGTVIIKQAPGHTEGHSVLFVKLAKTGPVVLSGDLYHYPAERTLGRLPTFEVSEEQTKAARAEVDTIPEAHGRGALDPARPRGVPQAEAGAGVLRLVARAKRGTSSRLGRGQALPHALELLAGAAVRDERHACRLVVDEPVHREHR